MAKTWGHPSWTCTKLDVLREYLECYQVALKNTSFRRFYIDAFAGCGVMDFRGLKRSDQLTFDEWLGEEQLANDLVQGSAIQALNLDAPFDEYVFVEKSDAKVAQLEERCRNYSERRIRIENADANPFIQSLCKESWRDRRAVLFLDPFGMSVDWKTIEAVAETQAIDLWYLYPISAVNRLLEREGNIPPALQNRLNLVHGTTDWQTEFFRTKVQRTLLDDYTETTEKVATFHRIQQFLMGRLKATFRAGAVVEEPLVLRNTRNTPLFLLCFAAGNPKGAPIAKRIAKRIIENAS